MIESRLPRQHTSFVGRQHDLDNIIQQLNQPSCRLLTLAGLGGVGKTRLAIEIAVQLRELFTDGVYFIPLAPLTSVETILSTIAESLSLHIDAKRDLNQQLHGYLRDRHVLLIMDNYEHLLDGATLLSEILEVTSEVRVLVTSRELLNLQEECVWQVRGMGVPQTSSYRIEDYDSIQLFADRTQRIQREFSLADEQKHIVRICQLVEGLPLALEMAAAWRKSMTCQAIADQIELNIDFLNRSTRNAPQRHQSIRAVFDYSWNLLEEREQIIFANLSVFRGGFSIEAAVKVSGASIIDLTNLVDKSMIQLGFGQRYDIHELLRQYAEEKLPDDGTALKTLHATYFARFLSQQEKELKGHNQKTALAEIAADFDNIRTAWMWSVQADRHDLVSQMLWSTFLYLYMRDHLLEINQLGYLAFAHFQLYLKPTDPTLLQFLLFGSQNFHPYYMSIGSDKQPSKQTIYDQFQQTIQMLEQQSQHTLVAFGLKMLGHFHEASSEFEEAIDYFEQSLALYHQLNDRFHMSWLLQRLGVCYTTTGDWKQGYECTQRCVQLSQEIGNIFHGSRALTDLGTHELYHASNLTQSHYYLEQAANEQRDIDSAMGVALASVEIGYLAFLRGDIETVTSLVADIQAIANNISRTEILSAALALQALLVALNGDNEIGKHLANQSLHHMVMRYPTTEFWAQMALNMTIEIHQDSDDAQRRIHAMLQLANRIQSPLLQACSLPFLALLFVAEDKPQQAVEHLALAYTKLSEASGWLNHWHVITNMREKLIDVLGTESFEALWKRGTTLDIDLIISRLTDDPVDEHPNSTELSEPLSEREQEILQLIGEQLSNREIAERLFITVGTVKSHNNHIFSKLGVKNRTEAIYHARTLGLL